MTDEELDLALRAINPYSDAHVSDFDLGSSELELMESLMSTPLIEHSTVASLPEVTRGRRRRWPAALVAAAAAVTAAFAVTTLGDDGGSRAYAAEAVAVAEANDRLLLRAPDWSIVAADEFSVDQGEITFTDGQHEVWLHWRPVSEYEGMFLDRADDATLTQLTVLGRPATMFDIGAQYLTTLVEPETSSSFTEIRGDLGSTEAYLDMLGEFRAVGVEEWLDAMPDSVVTPDDRRSTVAQMLVDVPLPAGFDVDALSSAPSISSRYQLGYHVATSVVCGWVDSYFDARDRGDDAGVADAADAVASVPGWPLAIELSAEGDGLAGIEQLGPIMADGTIDVGVGPRDFVRDDVAMFLGNCG